VARDDLRYTPAGIPALSMTLLHASEQPEAGGARKVECELAAVAFGGVAESLATMPPGSRLRCEGFLARRYRTGATLALHIATYETVSEMNRQMNRESKRTEGN